MPKLDNGNRPLNPPAFMDLALSQFKFLCAPEESMPVGGQSAADGGI
jgi:hypothetical protein